MRLVAVDQRSEHVHEGSKRVSASFLGMKTMMLANPEALPNQNHANPEEKVQVGLGFICLDAGAFSTRTAGSLL